MATSIELYSMYLACTDENNFFFYFLLLQFYNDSKYFVKREDECHI